MEQPVHTWDANLYTDKHSFVYEFGASLVDVLAPMPNERILDLGCGSGQLTNIIREQKANVIGMDASTEMIEKAKVHFPLCNFEVGDASSFHYKEPFDAIFSNATLHWVTNPTKAIQCMYQNLKIGGRLVVEFGGKHNVENITQQLRNSLRKKGYTKQADLQLWYFPSVGEYTIELEKAGFLVTSAQWYERLTELSDRETGIIDWLRMFCKPFLQGVEQSDIDMILKEVQENLRTTLCKDGTWFADYKRIRIVAYRYVKNGK